MVLFVSKPSHEMRYYRFL